MKYFLHIFCLFFFLAFAQMASAQKFGFVNSGNALAKMPETKVVDNQLQDFQKNLQDELKDMYSKYQSQLNEAENKFQSGEMTPVQQQEEAERLQKLQNEIVATEQLSANKIENKRIELLGPILTKLQTAIDQVGKENGYTMIFDTSVFNAILFADDADDLWPMVAAKLGVAP